MGIIKELPETLANQIAAGEVVERPASVVKELLENALDAGSTQIDITVLEAGLRKIEITDNGTGISEEDVPNAFKRHATSKIHTRDDLFRIRSLGFRGEALPSIASVSQITMNTSTGEGSGTSVYVEGGTIKEQKPAAARKGTKITVENLFFNTPARLKYVKTQQTELANIGDIVNRLALSHPEVAFRLKSDGHDMLTTTGSGELKQTLAGIYGISTAKKMIPIHGEDLDFQISGFVSLPELTRANRNYISLMINGRYIKNYVLNKAIIEGYGSKLMVGRFPFAALEIQMDPLLVDVNVHPTKQEVRLSKEKELMALISSAIQRALGQEVLIPNAAESVLKKQANPAFKPVQEELLFDDGPKKMSADHRQPNMQNQGLGYDAKEGRFYSLDKELEEDSRTILAENDQIKSKWASSSDSVSPLPKATEQADVVAEAPVETHHDPRQFPRLEYFGQMHGTYLFAQSSEGLYIVDQHAAQERIKYEYYRQKIGDVGSDQQELLVPIVLEYTASEGAILKERQHLLEEVGLFLEVFGQNSYLLRSHPAWYPKGEEEQIVREMIDRIIHDGRLTVAKFREDTAIMMSCKKSIKANHHLDEAQARQLLTDLALCENPYNCPHGRPVLIHFTNQDMEKMFKRIQDPH